jgi:uracil-DNA glycosylase
MDSTADDELVGELYDLTRQLRGQLLRHAMLGAWAAPGGATARTVSASFDPSPVEAQVESPVVSPVAPPVASIAPSQAAPFEAGPVAPADLGDQHARDAQPGDAPIALGRRTLEQIRAELGDCTRCKLHTTRRTIVFGVGDPHTPLMFVGEAPGEQEDKRGEPFVGPAGQLLDKMIEAMGWTRNTVYIANTTKCRPPGNRNPQPDELGQCMPFLHAQIAAIAPRIIVALGKPASNQLLGTDAPISALRGRFHDYARFTSDRHSLKIMPTFHPAYLLRDPTKKRAAWDDLKLVMAELARLGITAPNPT